MNSNVLKIPSPKSACARKRYYSVFPDFNRNPSDFTILNEGDVVNYANRRAGMIDGLSGRNYGLPEFKGILKIQLGKNKRQDYIGIGHNFVSTRAKELLESLDSKAFDFVECETIDWRGKSVESYWWLGVTHIVADFDSNDSEFAMYSQNPELKDKYPPGVISDLFDIRFNRNADDHAAFYLAGYSRTFIWSEKIVDAWRAQKLTGRRFTGLQQPTRSEIISLNKTENYLFWKERLGI